jgi:hypothetical protein
VITERDLDEAITECQGKRNPDAQTCMKLAAFYTIKQNMFGKPEPDIRTKTEAVPSVASYSYSAGNDAVQFTSASEFVKLINGLETSQILPLIDDLVETIRIINPKLYNAFIGKIKAL